MPPGVVTVTKYAVPDVTTGEVTWMHVGRAQPGAGLATMVAATGGLYVPVNGFCCTKFTVSPPVNPVPWIVTVVPPVMGPVVG